VTVIRMRDSSSWYEETEEGITLVVLRRSWEAGGYEHVRSSGGTTIEAERAYDAETSRREGVMNEQARRRALWGPL
jgi:hypothetical protein